MPILEFPSSPTLNQVYTLAGASSYKWNGYAWDHVLPTGPVVGANQYIAKYLAIGGGGGSQGYDNGGGGGAGGFVEDELILTVGKVCFVVIGAGGANGTGQSDGRSGFPTIIQGGIPAIGGGRGGYTGLVGGDGGSGGGGGTGQAAGVAVLGGSQGNNGQGPGRGHGGGAGGPAGVGKSSSISGAPVTYAKGGIVNGPIGNGAPNTGNGADATGAAYSGGSGIAYLEIPTAKYSGTVTGSPKVTVVGANTVLEFKTSGTYTG